MTPPDAAVTVLCIDDDAIVRQSLCTYLGDSGYRTLQAPDGESGLAAFRRADPDAVLIDLRLPGIDGLEVLQTIVGESPETPALIVSGQGTMDDAVRSLTLGAWDYVRKPVIDLAVFERTLARALERARLLRENRRYRLQLEGQIVQKAADLSLHLDRMAGTLQGVLRTMSFALKQRAPDAVARQQRVASLAQAIATTMGLPKAQVEGIVFGALLHDVGKLTLPSEYLLSQRPFTAQERAVVETHCQDGHDMLSQVPWPWPLAQIAYQHHERLDGSGYPRGLRGEQICLEARIVGVADVVEAMLSFRPYRPTPGLDQAIQELRDNRGGRYDPQVVDACLQCLSDGGFTFSADGGGPP